MNTKEIGNTGEKIACNEYLKKGYKLIKHNYRYKMLGEIDLIFVYETETGDKFIVFSEVKCRKTNSLGTPADAVNITKQQKIIKTAQCFLLENQLYNNYYIRFDVAEVYYFKEKFKVNIIENAFS